MNLVKIEFYRDLRRHLLMVFDTFDHWILLNKLNNYGFQTTPLKWFHSYFKDCSQYVDYDGTISKICPITTEVPQGSILGSLLFIIYMNDIHEASSNFKNNFDISCVSKTWLHEYIKNDEIRIPGYNVIMQKG